MSSSVSRSKKDLPQSIVIAGYYGHQNAGDEAILQGVLRELSELGRDLEFVVISTNPEAVESLHGVRSIAWTDTKELIDTIRRAALVVVGGGGLIQDYWGVDPKSFMTRRQGGITEFGSPILLAKLLGVRCMFYTVGVGPLRSEDGRLYSRILFEAADGATVRDEGSRQLLQEIGVDTEGISIASDPAFRTSFPEVDQRFHTQLEDLPGPKIGVSLRYWNFGADPEEWGPQVSLALDQVVDAVAGTVVLVPMHLSDYILEDDLKVLMKVREDMQHRDRAILAPEWLDPIQRFFVMENFDLVLGMRLHSLIACLRAGVPCVGLQYDPKVKALLSGFGIEELCIDVSKLEAGALAERMLIAYMSKTVRFREIAEELREKLVNRSASAELADFLLDAKRPAKRFPPYLVDFAINQTLNLAEAEAQSAHLNQAIRKVWGARLGSTHPFEYTQTDLGWIVLQLEKDQERMASLEKDLKITQERLDISQSELMLKKQRLNETKVQLERERRSRAETEQALHEAQMEQAKLQDELDVIRNSRGYKLLSAVWGVLWRIRDPKQAAKEFRGGVDDRTRGFRDRTIRLSERIQFAILKVLPARYRNVAFVVRSYHLKLEDNSRVTLYTDDDELFPGYEPRRRLNGKNIASEKVTLITTVRNEADNAQRWLKDLEAQTRLPDEVILLEGGSIDNTWEILQSSASDSPLNLRVHQEKDTNIATRRNLGVQMASHPIIAMTDFGCTLEADWLEKMIVPFEVEPETEVVAGWYQAAAESQTGKAGMRELIPTTEDINPQDFLPATRSIAFRKSAWETVCGFPEWLTKTGEDTYFDLQLKKKIRNWAFVPDAKVIWHSPENLRGVWDKLSSWSMGDGESGAFAPRYWKITKAAIRRLFITLAVILLGLVLLILDWKIGGVLLFLWILLLIVVNVLGSTGRGRTGRNWWERFGRLARVHGFLRGMGNRPAVAKRHYAAARSVVLFLSGVPIDDTGGGARGTQIALELLRRGDLVVFVHKYPKQEHIDLNLDFSHDRLMHFSLTDFDWKALYWELQDLLEDKPLTAIVEFPFKEYLSIAKSVHKLGGTVVYDLIDEWNTSLGEDWYSPEVEQSIIERSDVLMASAPLLVERLERASGRETLLVPNAVNLNIFNRNKNYPAPDDLPEGNPRILYIGALWGEWFDWCLLSEIARTNPEAAVVVIGDYNGQCPHREANLHFLGLKAQSALPAYLSNSDVSIIPWEISPITQSTSPLKVFEYIAMGVPVVAPKLKPLADIPYVYLAEDREQFLKEVGRAQSCRMEDEILDAFLAANSWQARMDTFEEAVGLSSSRGK